ncbi:MAG: carbohydrate ABC transporter permease [Chloroflexi bacterium]|nr:carbohydrate ABC transporter permease [Chloroflexota bacterium]
MSSTLSTTTLARRSTAPHWASRLGTHLLLLLAAFIALLPFFWMLSTALKTQAEVYTYPPVWIPLPPHWENFTAALSSRPFLLFFKNTVVIATAVVVGDVLSCTLVGYGFARLRFPGRDVLFMVLLATIMMPFIVRLVPLFVLFQKLGWVNTYLPLTVPAFFGTPFFIFLVRQFFLTIPSEITDAARVDGANELVIWWRIMLPLSGPILAVITILAFQQVWNDFLGPLIFLSDQSMKTLALGLQTMLESGSGAQPYHWLMAVATTMTLPVVLLFLVFQRYFIQGVVMSGLKG